MELFVGRSKLTLFMVAANLVPFGVKVTLEQSSEGLQTTLAIAVANRNSRSTFSGRLDAFNALSFAKNGYPKSFVATPTSGKSGIFGVADDDDPL